MFKNNTLVILSIAALALLSYSFSPVVAKPEPGCAVRDNGCKADDVTFTFTPDASPPFPTCYHGVSYYTLSATIRCGIGLGDVVSGLVCPATSQPLSFNLDGQIHTFAPASGYVWQDVIDDCQSHLTYSVN